MKYIFYCILLFITLPTNTYSQQSRVNPVYPDSTVRTISSGNIQVDVIIGKPMAAEADAILCFHGTVSTNDKIIPAARQTMEKVKSLVDRKDLFYISVAYPEEGLLMGDQVAFAEAALVWAKQSASKDLGIQIRRIFLVGHSQGGYVALWLNSLHKTDGVIANAPGPIDLCFRCELEEKRKQGDYGKVCKLMHDKYGPASENPKPYRERSLLHITRQLSPVLVVQGMEDSRIQMRNWPLLKQAMSQCTGCSTVKFLEVPGAGHGALFIDETARNAYREMIVH